MTDKNEENDNHFEDSQSDNSLQNKKRKLGFNPTYKLQAYYGIQNFLKRKNVLLNFFPLFLMLNITIFFSNSMYLIIFGIFALFMLTISFIHMFLQNKKTITNDEFSIIKYYLSFQIFVQLLPIFIILFFIFCLIQEISIFHIKIIKFTLYFFVTYFFLIFVKFNIIFVAENLRNTNFYNIKKIFCLFNKQKIYFISTFLIDSIFLCFSFFLNNRYFTILYLNLYYLITLYFLLTYANIYKNELCRDDNRIL